MIVNFQLLEIKFLIIPFKLLKNILSYVFGSVIKLNFSFLGIAQIFNIGFKIFKSFPSPINPLSYL